MELELGGKSSHLLSSLQLPSYGFGDGKSLACESLTAAQLSHSALLRSRKLHFMIHLLSAPCAYLLGRMMAEFLGSYMQYQGPQIFWSKVLRRHCSGKDRICLHYWISSSAFASHSFVTIITRKMLSTAASGCHYLLRRRGTLSLSECLTKKCLCSAHKEIP